MKKKQQQTTHNLFCVVILNRKREQKTREKERQRKNHGAHGVEIEMFRRKESPEGPNSTKSAQQHSKKKN